MTDAPRTALLLSTAVHWYSAARMPRALSRAGFKVALLAPRDSLAEKSAYIAQLAYLPDGATPRQWLAALVRMIEAVDPALLLPCDEMSLRLMFALVLEPPPGLVPAVFERLRALIVASLGDPAHYAESIDKTLLPAAAERLGVRIPPYAIVSGPDAALAEAARLSFPVVLKRRFGFSGDGVAIVDSPAEVAAAATRLLQPDQLDLGEGRAPQLIVQAFIRGPYQSQALVGLRGEPLRNFAWERHVATTAVKGATSVLRFIDSPETLRFSEALCRGFGMTGFLNVQFVVDAATGEAHLLEINRRWVTHTHMGDRVGRDLGAALAAALDGRPLPPPDESARVDGDIVAVFPREWLRDPDSPYLTGHPVDVPWDEPELIEAMLAQRHT